MPASPDIRCHLCASDRLLMPWMALDVSTSWTSHCEDLIEKLSGDERNILMRCDGKSYRIQVDCDRPCAVLDRSARELEASSVAEAGFVVVPTQVGRFSFRVTLTRSDTGEQYDFRSPDLFVRAPDAVGLYCLYDPFVGKMFEPCDDRTLSADQPYILAVGEIGTHRVILPDAEVNGIANLPSHRLRLKMRYPGVRSLRDVYPDSAAGVREILPGRYEVTISYAGVSATRVVGVQ